MYKIGRKRREQGQLSRYNNGRVWYSKLRWGLYRDYGVDFKGYQIKEMRVEDEPLDKLANSIMRAIKDDIIKE